MPQSHTEQHQPVKSLPSIQIKRLCTHLPFGCRYLFLAVIPLIPFEVVDGRTHELAGLLARADGVHPFIIQDRYIKEKYPV